MPGTQIESDESSLASFLEGHAGEIVLRWEAIVRTLPHGRKVARPQLRDHVPAIIQGVAAVLRRGQIESLEDVPEADRISRGRVRLGERSEISELLAEFAALRQCVTRMWHGAPVPLFDAALDAVIDVAVARFSAVQQRLAESLARRAVELKEAVRSRDDVLAMVSHDLKNPLGVITMAASNLARDPAASPIQIRQAALIQRATVRMDHLIRDLLDVSVIEAGHLTLGKERFRVGPLIEDVVTALEPLTREKGLSFEREVTDGDDEITGDRDRLLQVLSNLLGNAVKFTEAGGRVTLRARKNGGDFAFEVDDTGRGIEPSDLPRVFDRYWKADPGSRRGSGLGLFISRALLDAMGGKITATSEPGRGSTFRFTLPVG